METPVDGLVCVSIRIVISGPSIRTPAVWQSEILRKWTLGTYFANQGTECTEQSSVQERVGKLLVFFWLHVHNALQGTHGMRFRTLWSSADCLMFSKVSSHGTESVLPLVSSLCPLQFMFKGSKKSHNAWGKYNTTCWLKSALYTTCLLENGAVYPCLEPLIITPAQIRLMHKHTLKGT